MKVFNYLDIGFKDFYFIYYEELELLVKNFLIFKCVCFWMIFGQEYLIYLCVIQNIGMVGIEFVKYKGMDVILFEFFKVVLFDFGGLGENYMGQIFIGCCIKGIKDGKEKIYYIWNNCSYQAVFDEIGVQGVFYIIGVFVVFGVMMVLIG